jgi:DNA-binding transcriptional regulator YhcF (GntR family)
MRQQCENAKSHSPNEGTTLRTSNRPIPLEFTVDRASREPLHRQIYQALRRAIIDRHLPAGSPLPSTRSLSRTLGVSRNTVLNAYEALLLEGFLAGKIGSGTRVRESSETRSIRDGKIPRPSTLLRHAHYPADPVGFEDPDGSPLYAHR